jgi:hypothetical protein
LAALLATDTGGRACAVNRNALSVLDLSAGLPDADLDADKPGDRV